MDSKGAAPVLVLLVVAVALIGGATAIWYLTGSAPIPLHNSAPAQQQGGAKVLVLGIPSQGLTATLSSAEAQTEGISYPVNIDPNKVTLELLKGYQVVIMQGDPYFDMNTREAVTSYANGGGKLIVVGDAGSKHPSYANVAGWAWPSGQGIPVPAQIIGEWAGYSDVAQGSEIRWVDMSHPIANGMKMMGTQTQGPIQVIKTVAKGTVIAAVDTDEGTVPAIIEGGSGFGNVIYFAYDPGQTPEILLATVGYLTGV
jgi:hypothetical protein